MNFRTDLALEAHKSNGGQTEGTVFESEKKGDLKISRLHIESDSAAQKLEKPKGCYITIEGLPLTDYFRDAQEQIETISKEITALLPEKGTVLVIGIGNTDITPDALGPFSADTVLATRHIRGEIARCAGLDNLRPTAVLSPGVLGQTGIETGEIIISLLGRLEPCAVIAIDALASKSISHLGKTIQISDSGISPGSGIGNHRLRLNQETLGIPVIGIGMPTVVDAATLVSDMSGGEHTSFDRQNNFIVTPKEIDLLIERASKLIGMAINCALQPDYSFTDLAALVS